MRQSPANSEHVLKVFRIAQFLDILGDEELIIRVVPVGEPAEVMVRQDPQPLLDLDDDREYEVKLYAACSDFFYWACADAEEILPEDISLLWQCATDLSEIAAGNTRDVIHASTYVLRLFAARKRKMRPMRAWREVAHHQGPWMELFLAAGREPEPS